MITQSNQPLPGKAHWPADRIVRQPPSVDVPLGTVVYRPDFGNVDAAVKLVPNTLGSSVRKTSGVSVASGILIRKPKISTIVAINLVDCQCRVGENYGRHCEGSQCGRCRAGARLTQRLAASVSRMTLLRILRGFPIPISLRPRVLGVVDLALRRGRRHAPGRHRVAPPGRHAHRPLGDQDDGHGDPFWNYRAGTSSTRRTRSSPFLGVTPPSVVRSVLEVVIHRAPSGATCTSRRRPYCCTR